MSRLVTSVRLVPVVTFTLAGCGGSAAQTPPAAPEHAPAASAPAAPVAKAAPPAQTASTTTPAPAEPTAEKCEGGWTCLRVSFDKKKVEPRETKLLGDPKIEETWSKTTGGRTVTFDAFSKGAVELTLKRKDNNKNEVVVKLPKGTEIVIDRHDGTPDDFSYIGAIATEQDGDLLVDIRYMK